MDGTQNRAKVWGHDGLDIQELGALAQMPNGMPVNRTLPDGSVLVECVAHDRSIPVGREAPVDVCEPSHAPVQLHTHGLHSPYEVDADAAACAEILAVEDGTAGDELYEAVVHRLFAALALTAEGAHALPADLM